VGAIAGLVDHPIRIAEHAKRRRVEGGRHRRAHDEKTCEQQANEE
jgi:hypothetical protein